MAAEESFDKPDDVFISIDNPNNKRLSIERIYQRKTQLEHILIRPDTYVGSVEETTEPMYIFDEERGAIIKRPVTFVPGLYKIFDEILVNAADNKQRDPKMNAIKVTIDQEENQISVWNNGRGIPVEMHSIEKMYVPELIFGTLLTSSNYNDSQRKVTGGRNGYGAKLCNIFSTSFTVETACSESKKSFKMTWTGNMGKSGKTIIKESKSDFTKVTFKPDLSKFGMTHLTKDMVEIMTRRVYDLAGITKGVSVYLNGKKLAVKSFKDYVELYVKGVAPEEEEEGEGLPRKVVHEVVNDRWEVAVTASPGGGFQQASFVNAIATTKGGTHVTYIVDQVVSKLLEAAKKKNKGGMDLKPLHVKSQLWVFVNCLIENPSFDSQTKENMTLKAKSFGSTCSLSDKFVKSATTCGVVERVLNWARAKSHAQLAKKQSGSKHSKLRGIAKLDDANEAGGKNSLDCTLIVTEGDSAKTLAVSGLGVIGRDNYGVFPLRGKLLNVREATHNQIMGNEEIKNLVKILGLQYNKKYLESAELKSLRYGHLMIMADQDQDGSHIKGLVINFIHHNWPKLLHHNFLEEFITPIVKVSKGRQERAFFSLPEFERWKAETEHAQSWKVKYYKGLGTSTAKEAKEYFSDMERHRIPFKYGGPADDDAIQLAFSKKLTDRRKEWLTSWLEEKKERRQSGMNESILYGEQTSSLTYADFINKELILFSNADNERSIPSVVDGLKPGQRKVLFTCFKRNDKRDIKVAQLAGSVAELSAYHHGEASLMSTIINLAQNFVGSNNINLLQPIGQFGTRLHGGKDAASPRYIFTLLSPLARLIFPSTDDTQLAYLREDNTRIEPEWYCPILPMVLVNGSEGIGTGYSTFLPNYNVRDIVANIKRLMNDLEPVDMTPQYKNFSGSIVPVEPSKFAVYGTISRLSPTSLEITELPIRTWTQTYKENVLEVMLHGNEKTQPFISDYKEYHTDTTVRFVVTLSQQKMDEAATVGFYKKFRLESALNTTNMVLFDSEGGLKRYSSAEQILREFYTVRLRLYDRRKEYLVGMLSAEAAKLTNQARFIVEKIEGKITIENKRKAEMISLLKSKGFRSDPIKAWKASLTEEGEEDSPDQSDETTGEEAESEGEDYNYLLSMPLWSLTREKKEELLKNRDAKVEELRVLQEKTPKNLWTEDLDKFMVELDRVEEQERQDEAAGSMIAVKRGKAKGGKTSGRQTKLPASNQNSLKHTKPSPFAETIQPTIPEFNPNPKKPSAPRQKKTKPKPEEGAEDADESGVKSESSKSTVKSVKAKKIAAAKAIKESFLSSGESDNEIDVNMDLASRIANRPSRAKVAPTSYAGMDESGEEESPDREQVEGEEGGGEGKEVKKSLSGSKPKVTGSSSKAREDSEPISIPDSDSDDDFITPPPPKKAKPPPKKTAFVTIKKAAGKTEPKAKAKPAVEKKASKGALKKAVNKPPQSKSQATLSMFSKPDQEGEGEGKEGGAKEEDPLISTKKSKSGPKVVAKKAAPKAGKRKAGGDTDDDEGTPVKKKPRAKKKPVVMDSDDEDYRGAGGEGDDSDYSDLWSERVKTTPPQASRRPARQRAKVTYNFDEDDEDDEQ